MIVGTSALVVAVGGVGVRVAPAATVPSEPLTLRIGTNDGDDAPAAASIEEFASQVDALSGGAVAIEPAWRAGGPDPHQDWDQVVARMVVSGELDMGLIPARAWDTEGVLSLRPLVAPFLVDSDALASDIADRRAGARADGRAE